MESLTISIDGGEAFGLLGPNGAGKTTTIKMLTTLLPPTSGERLRGRLRHLFRAREVRRGYRLCAANGSADGTLSGYENLLIFAKLYESREPSASANPGCLEFMGLADAERNWCGNIPAA